ncbi:MAG: aspartate-semialdehyde dehydrogenase [Christensenellaceae bacterium]|jgi:aspartate-semialdehyde dehydrogenase|nr:aspartate-semialdehyde dehydrogenase [Christensenellaceae bacterium]
MKASYTVGIIGATGMVGQRFALLLANHPWFQVGVLAASARSAGKSYEEAVAGRWLMSEPIPEGLKKMPVYDASDVEKVAALCDFVFCAVDMKKPETRALEEAYARSETPVVSNNSACRALPDVPMMIPEINPDHSRAILEQRKRLGTKKGFIAVKPNCSIQSYVPALTPFWQSGIEAVVVSTYQAISGAGKTFETMPEILDNVIPFISGEEEKSEQEPLKIWGRLENGLIVPAKGPRISAQCYRVPVSDGHTAAVSVKFKNKPSIEQMKLAWATYKGEPQKLELPSAPSPFLNYFEEENRPQARLDRDLGRGMGIAIGRLREDPVLDYRFVCLSHNTLRGAAGGGVLSAELLCAQGWMD